MTYESQFEEQVLDAAIIGAGPSGLIIGRLFADAVINFKIFERHSKIGGIWNIDAPGSPMYESCHLISSRTYSAFEGYPMPESYPDYPSHRQFLEYLESFADFYCLERHILLNSDVKKLYRDEKTELWTIEIEKENVTQIFFSKYLVICTGRNQTPNVKKFIDEETFNGEIRHSSTYKKKSEFIEKRVLIVGGGNSAADIACDAAMTADKAFISMRRGYYYLPKYIFGQPSDVFNENSPPIPKFIKFPVYKFLLNIITGDVQRLGLKKPDHDLLEASPLLNTQILHHLGHGKCVAKDDVERLEGDYAKFSDGTKEKVDLIITATGYKKGVPFLDGDIQDNLYLEVFSRSIKNLAFTNFITPSTGAFKHFHKIGEIIVADCLAHEDQDIYSELRRLKETDFPKLDGGYKFISSERHENYVDGKTYDKILDKLKSKLGIL